MKKIHLLLILVLVVASGLILFSQLNTVNNQSIKIGAILVLSGTTSSFYGEANKMAIDLLVSEINERGGVDGKNIEIVYGDSQGDKAIAVTIAQKFVAEGIKYVISDVSAVSVAIAPILEKAGVVLMATATSNPNLSGAGEYVFRTKYSATMEGEAAAKYISDVIKPKRVSFLYQNSDYGTGVYSTFSKKILEAGIQIVSSEKYAKDSLDFRSELAKIKAANPDLIVLAGFPKEIGVAIKQIRETGVSATLFAHSGSVGGDLYQAAGVSADGLINLTELDSSDSNIEYQVFSQKMMGKYGINAELISALAYDGLSLVASGIDSCGSDLSTECVKNHLSKIKNYKGVSGVISFDQNGDLVDRGLSCVIKKITLDGTKQLKISDRRCEN